MHPHRKACGSASKFLKELSKLDNLEPEHKKAMMAHHKVLDPIGHEDREANVQEGDTPGVEPDHLKNAEERAGELGEKGLDLQTEMALRALKDIYREGDASLAAISKKLESIGA
jgi:hypothetical protein